MLVFIILQRRCINTSLKHTHTENWLNKNIYCTHTHTLTQMQGRFDDEILTFRYAAANIIRCEYGESIVKILVCLFVPPNLGFTTKSERKKRSIIHTKKIIRTVKLALQTRKAICARYKIRTRKIPFYDRRTQFYELCGAGTFVIRG